MKEFKKLLIFTSASGDELWSYWKIEDLNHLIVKKLPKSSGKIDWGLIEAKIEEEGYLIMIHHQQDIKCEFKKVVPKGITYTVYYYSTQDNSLNGDLWSVNGYAYNGPAINATLPFDFLRENMLSTENNGESVNFNNVGIKVAVNKVFEWVNIRCNKNQKLNAALEFLHECIGVGEPEIETLNKAGFNLDAKAEGKSSLNELINKLKNGGDRIQIIKNLRDVLLETALQEK